MKKIIPFNNVLNFSTDVREITAISLEHEISKYPDMISGVFYISGEYKITDGQLEKEKFNFELPFDIALSSNYKEESLVVDIDDFRYDLISDKELKVNIDLYVDGEIEGPLEREINREEIELEEDYLKNNDSKEIEELLFTSEDLEELTNKDQEEIIEPERIDLLKEMLTNNKEESMEKEMNINITNENDNVNNNIFDTNGEESYVTYRVYKVMEGDTLDTILTKYNITKEMLSDYNNIENIKPGDKLIIPTNEN